MASVFPFFWEISIVPHACQIVKSIRSSACVMSNLTEFDPIFPQVKFGIYPILNGDLNELTVSASRLAECELKPLTWSSPFSIGSRTRYSGRILHHAYVCSNCLHTCDVCVRCTPVDWEAREKACRGWLRALNTVRSHRVLCETPCGFR